MAKYIDAEAAVYRLRKWADVDNQPRAIRRAAKYLEKFAEETAADMQEVRHGKWISDGDLDYCCYCHCEKLERERMRYCPNCGAKMDGGGE